MTNEDTRMVLEVWDALEELVDDFNAGPYRPLLDRHRARIEEIKSHEVVRALTAWGEAMKWFVYGCVAGGGQTDAHGAYASVGENGRLYCSFCHQPADERPRRRAVKEKERGCC